MHPKAYFVKPEKVTHEGAAPAGDYRSEWCSQVLSVASC
jgi:hypothetical protein